MKRTVLAVLVAAVLALFGCAMVLLYVRNADARAVAGKEAVQVLVAARRIPSGTTGAEVKKSGYVEKVNMPKSAVPADYLEKIDSGLDNLALTADLQPRQLLLRGAFAQPVEASGGMSIPEGKIAVTVAVTNYAGPVLLQPGSKVAVYDTFTKLEGKARVPAGDGLSRDHNSSQATLLLLPKVEVLAIAVSGSSPTTNAAGTATASDEAKKALGVDGSADKTKTNNDTNNTLVTLAVTQAEGARLIHAAQTGVLYLALLGSTSLQDDKGVDNDTLFQ